MLYKIIALTFLNIYLQEWYIQFNHAPDPEGIFGPIWDQF